MRVCACACVFKYSILIHIYLLSLIVVYRNLSGQLMKVLLLNCYSVGPLLPREMLSLVHDGNFLPTYRSFSSEHTGFLWMRF